MRPNNNAVFRLVIQRDGDYPLRLHKVPPRFDRQFGERLLKEAKAAAQRAEWDITTLGRSDLFVASREQEAVWVWIEPVSVDSRPSAERMAGDAEQ